MCIWLRPGSNSRNLSSAGSGKLIQSEQGNTAELEVLPRKSSMGVGGFFIYNGFPALHFSSKIAAVAEGVSCCHLWKKTYLLLAVWTPSHREDFCKWKRSCSPEYGHSTGPAQEAHRCKASVTITFFWHLKGLAVQTRLRNHNAYKASN